MLWGIFSHQNVGPKESLQCDPAVKKRGAKKQLDEIGKEDKSWPQTHFVADETLRVDCPMHASGVFVL
jgi:hypothetical protein